MRERPAAPAAAAAGVDLRTIVFAAVGVVSALALPFVRVRPNRVADGVLQLIVQLDPLVAAGLALLWLAAAGCAVAPLSARTRGRVTAAVSLLAPFFTILYAGVVCRRLGGPDPIARISLSTGFWVTMLASYAAFISASARPTAVRPAGPGGPRDGSLLVRELPAVGVPVVLAAMLLSGLLDPVSVMREFAVQKKVFLAETGTHAALAGAAVLIGGAVGVAIGVLALRRAVFRRVAFFIVNIVQTIPSLALFGLLILPLAALSTRFPLLHSWGISGIGRAPALIALSFYAMLPIARNTYTGLEQIPASLRDAGAGMGMTRGQLLARVEVPLALPLILAGVRTAAVQSVGNTVVTALIGAGGLGVFIFQGLGQFASDMILLGTLPVIAMAVLTDMLMGGLVRAVTPKPLREPGMIRFEGVTRVFGAVTAVDGLDLTVYDRELCILVGPSGSGKSTMLRMINRLIDPSAGRITLDGNDVTTLRPEILRRSIGYVIQSVGLFPHLTVAANIATVPELLGWDRPRIASRVAEMLKLVGMEPSLYRGRFPSELSGGEAQRIGVARALASDPPVVLMDEPFSAVDPVNRLRLQDEFLSIQRELKKTVVFVTHDVDEAIRLADRIAVVRAGRLVQYDTPEQILENPADPFVAAFVGADRALKRLSRFVVRPFVHPAVSATIDSDLDAPRAPGGPRYLWITEADGTLLGSLDTALVARCGEARACVSEENIREMAVLPDSSLKEALSRMIGTSARSLPVVDGQFRLVGEISLSDVEEASEKQARDRRGEA